ncbi:UDP-N-acetylglucosamine 2-epimerase (non-hydrolyzing) [Kineosporia sp. NBRC 101731]|uniref:non-hydrolyzing UDP-N-acetylglucosamine 2-epimerase n=1 Tax=Kineosporia sp. NBRC 101731 TaxID=3032199 RepID=UPI0024A518EC|nr:UDP-N-acetylglucosamine 2-epimerase (non-hydrolyzing) [Kineosporia sp. NBRC 101731]GLY28466.1 UDP-N-acetyl glucosamine 2-epimerase [Kineosporia sp. NBRC 101731]
MRKLVHVTGARPNFPKAAPVLEALHGRVEQVLVHTGQHYDDRLSRVFFDELGLPEPDLDLGVGSGSHAGQTAAVMTGLEKVFLEHQPDLVVVYGDINSTLAAALVAAKLVIPVAHVEAGLRSFDMTMPEEVNRRVTDQLSDLLLVTSADAVGHLAREGVPADRIHFVGNPMIDTLLKHLDRFDEAAARATHGLEGDYLVATLHRPSNVDDPAAVERLVAVLHQVAERMPLVVPLHPRGRDRLEKAGLHASGAVKILEPLPYTSFLGLVRGASAVLTDSGGVQEEATVLGVPCLTMRPNTERPVTITHGTNRLVTPQEVPAALDEVLARPGATRPAPPEQRPPLWDGAAGPRIAEAILSYVDDQPTLRDHANFPRGSGGSSRPPTGWGIA